MRVSLRLISIIILLCIAIPANSYIVTYKEQFYNLFHVHLIQYPDDSMENIYWLEQALNAPFANPLYAFALIETEIEWEKYRYLFNMHLNLKMIEQYLFLGNKWNKRNAYFYNAPFRKQNLESLDIAETCYRTALVYWDDALEWAQKANERRFRWINLKKVQFWQDEAIRIEKGTLDYAKIISRELALIQKNREKFMAMEDYYLIEDTSE